MNLSQLRQQVMFQTGNDAADLGDFQPHLTDYLNEGCFRLMQAYHGQDAPWEPLQHEKSMPDLPQWLHRAIADYATWMVYRNGSPQKQNRGAVFLRTFNDALLRARSARAEEASIHGIPL